MLTKASFATVHAFFGTSVTFSKKLVSLGWDLGPVSRKSRELFAPKNPVVKLQSACFENLIFKKTKRIAKFDGFEPRRCEDVKGIVAPEIGPKSFGTFGKRAPGP